MTTYTNDHLIKCGRNVTTTPHYHLSTDDIRSCYNGNPTQAFNREGTLLGTTNHDHTPVNPRAITPTPHPQHNLLASGTAQPPNNAQLKYYTDLCTATGTTPTPNNFNFRTISTEIDRLKDLRSEQARQARAAQRTNSPSANATPSSSAPQLVDDGVYLYRGIYYKVVTAQATSFKYAKGFNPQTKKFNRAPGIYRSLRAHHAVTPEQAKSFGQLYGICCFCARTLTDERSIGAGYGPTCAANHGLPWGDHTATPVTAPN